MQHKLSCHLIFFLFILCGRIISQNHPEDFHLTFPKKIISNGYYHTITFLDSRPEKDDLGYVYTGGDNRKTNVINKKEFGAQLKALVKRSIDSSNADGELLFQLRKFKFLEKPENASEFGFCLFRADLYVRQDSTYKKLSRIDSIIVVEAPDATKPLFDAASNMIADFVLTNLGKDFSNTENFTFKQIEKMDSVEKSRIKLFASGQYTNGVYKNYQSFKDQIPDFRVLEVIYKYNRLIAVKVLTPKGKKIKIKPDEFFAVITEGKPFISAEYGIYPLEKINGDFYFTGEGKVPKEKAGSTEEGADGKDAKENSKMQTAFYQIRLDHIDGSLMRIKQKN